MRITTTILPLPLALPLALLCAGLLAQEPTKTPLPPPALPDVKTVAPATVRTGPRAIERAGGGHLARPAPAFKPEAAPPAWQSGPAADRVLLDEVDGELWAMGRSYKARFSTTGAEYHPAFGPAAPRNFPLRLGVPRVTSDGEPLDARVAAPRQDAMRVEFDRGDFRERFDLRPAGIEQSFEFARLPSRGELVVAIPFASELEPAPDGGGIRFAGDHGAVTYGQAVAIGALGRRLLLPTTADNGEIRIVVPSAFLASARLPLIVDPLIGTESTVQTSARAVRSPDIAYDHSTGEYLAVWQSSYSSTDQDVFAQRLDSSLQNVGSVLAIDFTSACWTAPRVANNGLADRFLVVAGVSDNCSSPFWISGRTVDAGTGALGTEFDIAKAGLAGHDPGDKINPDVGGDPHPAGPTYFTVVWERAYTVSDHDIHMKQVTSNGALFSPTPTRIDNSPHNETNPTISKSNGTGSSLTQRWGVAYQRTYPNGIDEDIHGALVTWGGQLVPVGGSANFQIDGSTWDDRNPTISTPTDPGTGQRVMMVAYESAPIGGESDIYARIMDIDGGMHTGVHNLTLQEAGGNQNATFRPWPQTGPSVDSDGCRFALAYEELHSGVGVDHDTLVSLFAYDPDAGAIVLQSGRALAGGNTSTERGVAITATNGSGGDPLRYALAWYDERGTADDAIEAQLFDGYAAGGMSTRPTGCGGLTLSSTGVPAVGASMTFGNSATGLGGFLFGLPASVLATYCPGCELGVTGSTLIGPTMSIDLPCSPVYVGLTISVQAFEFAATGPCLGRVRLSDTLDMDLR